MRPSYRRKFIAALLASSMFFNPPATAEDIDLFTNPDTSKATAPNILIILDNSANWNRNDQGWTGALGESPFKQGQSELRALRNLMDDPNMNESVNFGLMMMTSGAPNDTGYIRFAVQPMTPDAKKGFKEMIGDDTCVDGPNSYNGTPNCLYKNFNKSSEQTNSASTRYSAALFEAFKYFGGFTDPANANKDIPGTPQNSTHFGRLRYGNLSPNTDAKAWKNAATKLEWAGPIRPDGGENCAKNYVVFIGNGYPSQDVPDTLLTGIYGDATNPPGIGNKAWKVANWSKYMNATDVNEAGGRQPIVTYTIDVFKNKTDIPNQTALLKGMAKYGGSGEAGYFEAKDEKAIIAALQNILTDIQSVNSVFASASLPINATNRSQNENQVFIGMFRPDGKARPRWYGNLKQFQIALFGTSARLADKDKQEAIAPTTGFIKPCAASFWTTDTASYWAFSAASAGSCTLVPGSTNSDLPDGGIVEKGGAAEVVRRGNNPAAPSTAVSRIMYTCDKAPCSPANPPQLFSDSTAPASRTGSAANATLIAYTKGEDTGDENANGNLTETRPSIHADIAHSRPLPVNFGGTRKVVVYYGANDGPFRAVEGATGKELWSFIAPEHHAKLKRLQENKPLINYPGLPVGITPAPERKDYFFDGAAGLYQSAMPEKPTDPPMEVFIYPTQRRGGRMVYGFDVSATTPDLKFAVGCPNLTNDTGCTAGMAEIGQTWSAPNVAFIKSVGANKPVLVMGGGYDACEDTDSTVTTCPADAKGNRVYILDGKSGKRVNPTELKTLRSVAADVTLIDRDFDGMVDHAYIADTGGNIYRIDFQHATGPSKDLPIDPADWKIVHIAKTDPVKARKFLFGPSALAVGVAKPLVYLALGSGDRERPLEDNYPFKTPVVNKFYSFIDDFGTTGLPVDLDGPLLEDFTKATACSAEIGDGKVGWSMELTAYGVGEQTVTSSVIFGGTVFFSTNRPTPKSAADKTCGGNLGQARGYAVNLLNASGVIGKGALCGGERSGEFTGGGIPPSPVVGTVPVKTGPGPDDQKSINILIGGIDLTTGDGSPIGAQQPPVPITQVRSRVFWYPGGER